MKIEKSGRDLQNILAQGWTTMFIIFLANIVMDITRCNVEGDCAPWAGHMGIGGVSVVTIVLTVYAVMTVLVRLVSAKVFRFASIGITSFITLFYVAHELTHLVSGDKPFGIFHSLDIVHHVIGITMVIVAVKWARELKSETVETNTTLQPSGEAI